MSNGIRSFFSDLRKKRIIEILAAFIAGGWLIIEFVHFILIGHYHFPDKTLDITFITLIGVLICTLVWRWFSGRAEPRKFKLELVLIPLIALITVLLDVSLLLYQKAPEPEAIPTFKWKNSIAVLPFVDMSPQRDQEYFCDGMTEDLINRLGNVQELKVPARTSAFMFKGKTPDMHEVGEKLKVETALEGSVQKSGNKLRITAQLINIADGYHLWSEKYDRESKDVFAIQDEIASSIVDALRLKLTAQEKDRMSGHSINDIAAYECYLRAKRETSRGSEDALNRALQELQNGLRVIGDNALLYCGMASVYNQFVNIGVGQEEDITRSEEYAKKAIALDPNLPEAYHALALPFYYGDYPDNLQNFFRNDKLALALDPNLSSALLIQAEIYIWLGKPSRARPLLNRLTRVDPLNPSIYSVSGLLLLLDGKYAEAIEQFEQRLQFDPTPFEQFFKPWALVYNGEIEKAIRLLDQSTSATPNHAQTKLGQLLKYGLLKDREKAFQIMTPDFQQTCRRDLVSSYCAASMLSLLDAKKEALDWMENAVNKGFINYPVLNEKDPFLNSVRGEPRFQKLLERVKFEWEHFEE